MKALEAEGLKEPPKEEAEMMAFYAKQKEFQMQENRENLKMRERILALATEADKYGYFNAE